MTRGLPESAPAEASRLDSAPCTLRRPARTIATVANHEQHVGELLAIEELGRVSREAQIPHPLRGRCAYGGPGGGVAPRRADDALVRCGAAALAGVLEA